MGEQLVSPNKKAALMLQKDGNLVLRCQTTDKELWASGTAGVDVVLKVQVLFGELWFNQLEASFGRCL